MLEEERTPAAWNAGEHDHIQLSRAVSAAPRVPARGPARAPAAVARGAVRHRNVGSVPPLLAFAVYKLKLPPPHFQLDPGASNKMGSGDLKLFA